MTNEEIKNELDFLAGKLLELKEAEERFKDEHAELIHDIEITKKMLGEEIVKGGKSVNADGIQAVYTAGRVSWDNKFLSGYAAGHPEILEARKEGKPTVTFRLNREK